MCLHSQSQHLKQKLIEGKEENYEIFGCKSEKTDTPVREWKENTDILYIFVANISFSDKPSTSIK